MCNGSLFSMLCLFLEFPVSVLQCSIIQSMSFCQGLPLLLFPFILSSIISLCRELPLIMWPIQFFCLVLIISIKDLFRLPVSILLYSFCVLYSLSSSPSSISTSQKPLSVHWQRLRFVQRDAPNQCFNQSLLMSLFSPLFNNSFLLVNASFPIAFLFLISLWHFAASDISFTSIRIRCISS